MMGILTYHANYLTESVEDMPCKCCTRYVRLALKVNFAIAELFVPAINAHTRIAARYKRTPEYQNSFQRLARSAELRVPAIIARLRRIPKTSMSYAVQAQRDTLVDAWSQYAAVLELTQEESQSALYGRKVYVFWTCSYKYCLCHGKKPTHKLYICKGCWQAFYCNERCQSLYVV